MTEQSNGIKLNAAVVSDRGLSKKRPLNEDSFLSDPERRIFAVADGVGGAQAGEVASQTAMEVLDEAFRHIEEGVDVEDLLEIAIQRANSSIHRMSHEHPKLSMMATTVVVLHLDGRIATIGHVGDSRLYRLTPDGKLHRETADHSVVEEEVRAGRMTPEQASNHPSRNVISRALGAEESVEVDLKTIEVADGTSFLLCSDGITRHIPDPEIRELLTSGMDLEAICEEMKRRCYERGAEDNLTAVIVRVGDAVQFASMDDERTIVTERPQMAATMSGEDISVPSPAAMSAAASDPSLHDTAETPAKAAATKAAAASPLPREGATAAPIAVAPPPSRSAFKTLLRTLIFLVLLAIAGGAGFLFSMYYLKPKTENAPAAAPANIPAKTEAPQDAAKSPFEVERASVDENPQNWLNTRANNETRPTIKIDEQEFLYLKGRALYLTKHYQEALQAFNAALAEPEKASPSPKGSPLRVEILFGKASAAVRAKSPNDLNKALNDLDLMNPNATKGDATGEPIQNPPAVQRRPPPPRLNH